MLQNPIFEENDKKREQNGMEMDDEKCECADVEAKKRW